MATRTAPAVNGTPSYTRVSITFIDASEDIRSVALQAGPGATNAQIEALVDDLQDASNASIFKVEVTQVYNSNPQVSSATEAIYPSVYDNVVLLFKTPANQSQNVFIPAPNDTVMPADSDTPGGAALTLLATNANQVLNGTPSLGYNPISARFTERREKNQRTFI